MADLPLLDEKISRNHAEVVIGPDGGYWLVDLDSANGTFVEGKPIRRVKLRQNSIFQIQSTRFVFEEEIPSVGSHETFVTSYKSAPSRCGTIEYDSNQLSSQLNGKDIKSTSASNEKLHRVVATYFDGRTYSGNLVDDIAKYRVLELKMNNNELHSTRELDRFERLRERLCLATKGNYDADSPRVYARLSCGFPATLRRASGERISVAMSDLGVDGAQTIAFGHKLQLGEPMWLTIDLVTGPRTRTLVFTSEVAWTKNNYVGLLFSGRRARCSSKQTHQQLNDGMLGVNSSAAHSAHP